MTTQLLRGVLLFLSLYFLISCGKDEIIVNETEPVNLSDNSEVKYLIFPCDQMGLPLYEVNLNIEGEESQYLQNASGLFVLENLRLPFIGKRITIRKAGYFDQIKLLTGEDQSNHILKVVLIKKDFELLAGPNDIVNLQGGGRIQLPSKFIDQNQRDYIGNVKVVSHYFDPADIDYILNGPGNMLGLNKEGEYVQLGSFGMYAIELFNPDTGEELNLNGEDKAELFFPISEDQKGIAVESIPFWSMNETSGIWEEEGEAKVDGNYFRAALSHLSFWNCDLPYSFVPGCLKFIDEDLFPITGLEVKFSVNNQGFSHDFLDANGRICGKFPIGEEIRLDYFFTNGDVGSKNIGPYFEPDTELEIILDSPRWVRGRARNCDGAVSSKIYGFTEFDETYIPILIGDKGNFQYYPELGIHRLLLFDPESAFYEEEINIGNEDVLLNEIRLCPTQLTPKIGGRVTIDIDEDGVDDEGVAGLEIKVINSTTGAVEFTTTTDSNGNYEVDVLPFIEYQIILQEPESTKVIFNGDRSPEDLNIVGEEWTNFTRDGIRVFISEETEEDLDNDFQLINNGTGEISGRVLRDTNGDKQGDEPYSNLQLTIHSFTKGTQMFQTVNTDEDGRYTITAENLIGNIEAFAQTISDYDESPDPDGDDSGEGANGVIPVRVKNGELDKDNNFVIASNGTISGYVLEDIDGDGTGDRGMQGVEIRIDAFITEYPKAVITDEFGYYELKNNPAGIDYLIREEQTSIPFNFIDIYDGDESPDDSNDAVDGMKDNSINCWITSGEVDSDNNFVNTQIRKISGSVKMDTNFDNIGDQPIIGIDVNLFNLDGVFLETTVTDNNGDYNFQNHPVGEYIIRCVGPTGSISVSDYDFEIDGDDADSNQEVDDEIRVTLRTGECDGGNNFVDRNL